MKKNLAKLAFFLLGLFLFNPLLANAQVSDYAIKQEIYSNFNKASFRATYDIKNKLQKTLKKETNNSAKAEIAKLLMWYNLQEFLYVPKSIDANWTTFRNKEDKWYKALWGYSKYLKYMDNKQNEEMSSAFLQSMSVLEKQERFKDYKVLDLYISYALTYLKYCPDKKMFDNIDKRLTKIVIEFQCPEKGVYTLELYKYIAENLRNK